MELLSNFGLGLATALTPQALLYCFIGVTVGTLVGVLPGIGAMTAISLALPMTFYIEPTLALIMLAGIFYGAQYGGSTASILLNLPGTVTNAVTCIDGYPLAQQGKAGVALFITAIASFIGSSLAIVLAMGFSTTVAELAVNFSSYEYFSVMLLGLIGASTLSSGSAMKGLASVILGVALGIVGTDVTSGQYRFTFGLQGLSDGVNLVAIAMGLFGISELVANIGRDPSETKPIAKLTLRSMVPNRDEWRQLWAPSTRGSILGAIIGILPGAGPVLSSFMSYAIEKKIARDPSLFGKGAIEGIAAPEAANNAATQAGFIPTLSLGIPGDALMALLLGAMLIHGISPGPTFITDYPEMFWGLIMSFWVGNIMLLVLNIPMNGVWVKMLQIPYHVLYPSVLVLICIGVYSTSNNPFDIYVTLAFGLLGVIMNRLRYPTAPLLLGFVLGPLLEEHFRRAMLMSRGHFAPFVDRPISAVFVVATTLLVAFAIYGAVRRIVARRPAPAPMAD